jgi:hypothetical protein
VALFALHALVLTLLLGYWPTPRALYPAWLHLQGNAVYGDVAGVELRTAPPERYDTRDTVMEGLDPASQEPRWRARFDALSLGYWPSAALLALLLATPLGGWRRLAGALAGLVWIHGLALLRIGMEILRANAEVASGVPGAQGAAGELLALRATVEVLNSNIVTIAAVLVAWVAVARPRRSLALGSLQRLLGLSGRSAS